MGQALYRQYRPKSLAEVVGQEHITKTILYALQQGKLAHAYLFTGPRGVGKTSIARILAHEINGLPYEDDSMHLDIIEIDAASNRRIDEIRELRDKVTIAPSIAKYKVYIIDEVHMLTREAFNALLKTLEEPPAHAIFILATTESHKLPDTIVSRTQRFIFKPVGLQQVAAHLRFIAVKEHISVSDEALDLIAAHGEGSFRDSISLLDQTRGHDGAVDGDYVRSLIGIPTDEAINGLVSALAQADVVRLSRIVTELRDKGFDAPQVAKFLGQRLRSDVLAGGARAGIFELMSDLLEVPVAHDPDSFLELSLLASALAGHVPQATTDTQTPPKPDLASSSPLPSPAVVKTPPLAASKELPPAPEAVPVSTIPVLLNVVPIGPVQPVDENLWPEILNALKKSHNTLYGIARMAHPVFYEDALELGFGFAFHQKRLSENKNKEIVIAVIKQLTGREVGLRCVMISKDAASKPIVAANVNTATVPAAATALDIGSSDSAVSTDISAIKNIFGTAEVLDS